MQSLRSSILQTVKMFKVLLLITALFGGSFAAVLPWETKATYVTRAQWGARNPTSITTMALPVSNVVIHHTFSPGACTTSTACASSCRSMQNFHMDTNGWADIGYNFLVGGDNLAYVGRGWDRVGAHAPGFNSNSIGIVVIGDWTSVVPPAAQLAAVRSVIADGVARGAIRSNYRLLGHRQAVSTSCPGNALYAEIQKWPQWSDVEFPDVEEEIGA